MTRIPDHLTRTSFALPGATPSIAAGAPGADVAFVIDRVQSRCVNSGAGVVAPQFTVTDPVAGVRLQAQLGASAAAGALGVDDLDLEDLGIVISTAQGFTVAWTAAAPAGVSGLLIVTYHLSG